MSELTQPIKWHGGKHYLAKWIIGHMPPHVHYVEPYFGGGSVLLAKDPDGVSEVVNDLNEHLSNFWMTLANAESFASFCRSVQGMPFSELLFEGCQKILATTQHRKLNEQVPDAIAFFVVARQSRQGLMKDFATLSRNRTRRDMNEQVSSWLTAIEGLPDIHARLKQVVILHRPAMELIEQQDELNTLFYLDPPYLHETRTEPDAYQHEMTAGQHEDLLNLLAKIKGKFLLSGYPSAMYEDFRRKAGWSMVSKQIDNKASSAEVKEMKTECLWANYPLEGKDVSHE